jgi:hypothetical protein
MENENWGPENLEKLLRPPDHASKDYETRHKGSPSDLVHRPHDLCSSLRNFFPSLSGRGLSLYNFFQVSQPFIPILKLFSKLEFF